MRKALAIRTLVQGCRALDSSLVTAPELLAEEWAQNIAAVRDRWFFPGKQSR